ncbi:MAG: hypothetical protein ACYTG0_42485 [Planctomycetota bacterium]
MILIEWLIVVFCVVASISAIIWLLCISACTQPFDLDDYELDDDEDCRDVSDELLVEVGIDDRC